MNRYLQEQASDAISRAQHRTRTESVDLKLGTWVMYVRRGKVTRGAIGVSDGENHYRCEAHSTGASAEPRNGTHH